MKIGILTQPLSLNYGGILQAWALQQVLKMMAHEPEIISRNPDRPPLDFNLLLKHLASVIKSLIVNVYNKKSVRYIRNPFKRDYNSINPEYCDNKFVKNNIYKTKKLFSVAEFEEWIETHNYDAFIVGSDQTWREEYSPKIETYFLDFIDPNCTSRKISYAASFGTTVDYISPEKLPKCQELMKNFDAISIREDGGLKIAKEVFNRQDAVKVLDPTLLLDQSYYKALIDARDNNKEGYIATYILDSNEDLNKIIKDISLRLSLPVNVTLAKYDGKKMPTISQWLANIANSEFVITDSFHGCVFSIIFKKQFIVIGNNDRGLDRFNSLLDSLGLSSRMVIDFDDYKKREVDLMQNIDFNNMSMLLKQQQKTSLQFLKDALA